MQQSLVEGFQPLKVIECDGVDPIESYRACADAVAPMQPAVAASAAAPKTAANTPAARARLLPWNISKALPIVVGAIMFLRNRSLFALIVFAVIVRQPRTPAARSPASGRIPRSRC